MHDGLRSVYHIMIQRRYEQIAEILENKIRDNEWGIGQKIPGELELAKEYHVARSTIRETLNVLQQKGMVEKKHGSGTYVTENKQAMENPLIYLDSVGKMIQEAGYVTGSNFYGAEHELPDDNLRKRMQLKSNEKIVIVNRERTADQEAVVFSYNIFPEKLVGNIFDSDLQGSIFQILESECNIYAEFSQTIIKGINPLNKWDREAEAYLTGSIVLLEQMHFDKEDRPILLSYDYINTDMVTLKLKRERK